MIQVCIGGLEATGSAPPLEAFAFGVRQKAPPSVFSPTGESGRYLPHLGHGWAEDWRDPAGGAKPQTYRGNGDHERRVGRMTVTIHSTPHSDLTPAQIEAWRSVSVAIAVDLARDIGQIDPAIRPLNPPGKQPRLFGRAVTVLCEPPDFGAVVHALEIVSPGDVLMIAAGGNSEFAMIGEILGGHVRNRRGVGVVCDGAVRDVATLSSWANFSVFARFVTPRGPASAEHGSVNCPVVVGGRLVTPGDLIIGDDDGLVALSPATVRSRISDAEAKQAREADWIKNLASGLSALETFGLRAAK